MWDVANKRAGYNSGKKKVNATRVRKQPNFVITTSARGIGLRCAT